MRDYKVTPRVKRAKSVSCPKCAQKESVKRNGFSKIGTQAYMCQSCGTRFHFLESGELATPENSRGAGHGPHLDMEKANAYLAALSVPGTTSALATRLAGVAQSRGFEYRNRFKPNIPDCPCGRPGLHNGHCSYRAMHPEYWPRRSPRDITGQRAGYFYLGFMSGSSMHASMLEGRVTCHVKGCPFPAILPNICRYHVRFFNYEVSLTDVAIDDEDIFGTDDTEPRLSVVVPWDNSLLFEYRGKRVFESQRDMTSSWPNEWQKDSYFTGEARA